MKKKDKKNKKRIFFWATFIIGLLIFLFLTQCTNVNIGIFTRYGHGEKSINGLSNSLKILGISQFPDHIDDETGEEFCFNRDCWAETEEVYEACMEGEELMLNIPTNYKFFEIIPSTHAIMIDIDDDRCEDDYYNTLIEECSESCEEEYYEWDGRPVNDIGSFYENNYPISYDEFETKCTNWLHRGIWINTPEMVGCLNVSWAGCESNAIISAGEVCTAIGKNYACNPPDEIVCKE